MPVLRLTLALTVVVLLHGLARAQAPVEPVARPLPVCGTEGPLPVTIEAESIEQIGPLVCAKGRVFFLQGSERAWASEACYDLDASGGVIRNAVFTTCSERRPDYRIEAREVRLLPNNRLTARHVSLYIGNFRVLTLPALRFRVGGRAATRAVFPRPGYDSFDGFTLSQAFRLVDRDRAIVTLDLSITQKNSFSGELVSAYGFGGDLVAFPGRLFTYGSLREKALDLPQRPAGAQCDPQLLRPANPARLRSFGVVTLKQRTFDIRNEDLVVNRQPELGLSYIGHQIYATNQRLDPRLEIYPEYTASWGRFEEEPGAEGFLTRRTVSALVPVSALPLGESSAVQPMGFFSLSRYGNGDEYRNWTFGIDASHLFPGGSFVSGRYLRRYESGVTPFQFDNVDINREFQAAFQVQSRSNILGLVLNYDLSAGSLYEWETAYAYRTDCLQWELGWNSRLERVSFNVTLVNL